MTRVPCSTRTVLIIFGCLLLTSCGYQVALAPSIVGKWQSDADSSNTIEFFPDGTLREVALLKTSNGKYVLLDGGRLKMEIDGLLWGTNTATWKYSINGNNLTMTTEGAVGLTLNFTRTK